MWGYEYPVASGKPKRLVNLQIRDADGYLKTDDGSERFPVKLKRKSVMNFACESSAEDTKTGLSGATS